MTVPQVTVKTDVGGVRVVVCSGDFDLDTINVLVEACADEDSPAGPLVVDVAGVSFADSSFLNAWSGCATPALWPCRARSPTSCAG
ncbi:STAS domain-containing protein [Streptomyces sp. NPDC059525]|uniref:STAS domain-containing protein n=1 Tax=Streptomyces sp. NPDC059525 TaxID=3346857 RepID=UPI00367F1D4E